MLVVRDFMKFFRMMLFGAFAISRFKFDRIRSSFKLVLVVSISVLVVAFVSLSNFVKLLVVK